MRFLLVMLFLTCACNLQAQVRIITTIAGDGDVGYGGDGGPATNAKFNAVQTLCYYNDNIYVPDGFNNRIRKIDLTTGLIITIAGTDTFGYNGDNIPSTNAELWLPDGIWADTNGNIFFGDDGNQRIRRIDAQTGFITTVAGNGVAGYSGDGGQATNAEINGPFGITMDKYGNLYFADFNNTVVRKIAPNGIITTIAGNGIAGYLGDGGIATNAELNMPNKAMVDTAGDLIVMDGYNQVIRKINATTGIITTIAGTAGVAGYSGDGGPASNALLHGPGEGFIDKLNNLYFSDGDNGAIRKIDGAGIITTVVGHGVMGFAGDGGPATAAEINASDVCADNFGTMYIADLLNYRIRMVYNPYLAVNTQSIPKNEVRVFPNPAQNTITVRYDFVNDGELQVMNIMGQDMLTNVLSAATKEKQLDISNLPSGLYLYRVAQHGELVSSGKIVKD